MEEWDVSDMTATHEMFDNASSFNADMSALNENAFNVERDGYVQNICRREILPDIHEMFHYASSFNSDISKVNFGIERRRV